MQGLRFLAACTILGCLATGGLAAPSAVTPAGGDEFKQTISPFLTAHCLKCHGPDKQSGDFRVDEVSPDRSKDAERWQRIADQIRDGLMPPKKQPQPPEASSKAVLAWVAAGSGAVAVLPNKGNLVPHDLLFGQAVDDARAPGPRIWLLSPDAYMGWVRDVSRGRNNGIVQPFTAIPDRGIKSYSALYSIDEQSTQILVRNAELIVESQTAHEVVDGKVRSKHDTVGEFVKLMDPGMKPTPSQLEAAVRTQFKLAIGRTPDADETARFIRLYESCAKLGDSPAAVRTMLQAVLLRSDAMYRMEVGLPGDDGRHRLTPLEIARAISLAIGDRRDEALFLAAARDELRTTEQVAAQVRRVLDHPKTDKSRLLRFFREYFEYHLAVDVFKDPPKDIKHDPVLLVRDTDRLVQYVLDQDKDVFRQLLTTPLSFANAGQKENKQTRQMELVPAVVLNPVNDKGLRPPEAVYGFTSWPTSQPARLPENTRFGILMQPSWLVSHSTNFDNDPVRRGRWIRERLLGGTVPDIPIGVAAQVPDDEHRTFRDRLKVTRAERCWVCHRRMDDLGLPFEQFDHFGRFRAAELVVDPDATRLNVDKKGKPLGKVYQAAALDTTGLVADTGDPRLDGAVSDPRQMIQRLSDSDRARQVFIRHAFRYFMGRNESLADARVLRNADQAYVQSGGSFKALVVSLLSSDAFLTRSPVERAMTPPAAAAKQ